MLTAQLAEKTGDFRGPSSTPILQPLAAQSSHAGKESSAGSQSPLAESLNNSSRAMQQKSLNHRLNNSPRGMQLKALATSFNGGPRAAAAQRQENSPQPNHTGLPGPLKSGVEALSGISLDNVRVQYNSDKPAQLNALAY